MTRVLVGRMAVLVPLAVASLALTFSPAADKQISQLMMKHDPILHWARRLLPPPRAAAASALYTWCRQLDEITDEPGASPDATRARLDEWESNFDALVRGEPVDELDGALLATMRAHPTLGRAPFDAMLQGMRDDTAGGVETKRAGRYFVRHSAVDRVGDCGCP